jgi:hypothetical protein
MYYQWGDLVAFSKLLGPYGMAAERAETQRHRAAAPSYYVLLTCVLADKCHSSLCVVNTSSMLCLSPSWWRSLSRSMQILDLLCIIRGVRALHSVHCTVVPVPQPPRAPLLGSCSLCWSGSSRLLPSRPTHVSFTTVLTAHLSTPQHRAEHQPWGLQIRFWRQQHTFIPHMRASWTML